MDSKVYKKIFAALLIIFASLTIITSTGLLHPKDKEINVKRLEKVLYTKESIVDQLLSTLLEDIKLHDYQLINNVIFFDTNFQQFARNEIYFALYSYDSLRFWSDNHIVLPQVLDSRFDLSINKIGNSWFEIRRRQFANYVVLGFIKIKDEFPYNNKYLQDRFATGFDFIPSQVNISLIPVSYGFDVKSSDGQYLFSLVPLGTQHDKKEANTLALVFFLLTLWSFFAYLAFVLEKARSINILISFTVLIALRVYMLLVHVPDFVYAHPFFKPILSFYSPGDLIIDIPLVLLGLFIFCVRFEYERYRPEQNYIAFDLVFLFLVNIFSISLLFFVYDLFYKLILSSGLSFEIFRIYTLSVESIVIVVILGLTLAAVFVFYYLMVRRIARYFTLPFLFLAMGAVMIVIYLINIVFVHYYLDQVKLLFFAPLAILLYFARKGVERFRLFMAISISVALFSTVVLLLSIGERNRERLVYQASHLDYFRDYVAEQILGDVVQKLENDDLLDSYLNRVQSEVLKSQIYRYLKLEYFSGYLKKYDLRLHICTESDYQSCQQQYYDLLDKNASRIAKALYFVNAPGRLPGYVIYLQKNNITLAIDLEPSIVSGKVGYPELLVDQAITKSRNHDYKYAVYRDGHLIYKSGEFIYPAEQDFWNELAHGDQFVRVDKYLHYLRYDKDRDYLIVVSIKRISPYDILITFSYLFFIFLLVGGMIFLLLERGNVEEPHKISFRTKLLIFMIGILTGAFIIVGLTTVAITTANYRRKFDEKIKNTLTRSRLVLEKQFIQSKEKPSDENIKYLVRNIADIINTDINLYDYQGRLLATSREKIYENNLLAPYIDYDALVKLLRDRFMEYIETEAIGSLGYTSAYTVINDNNRKIQGFINIPYFANSQEMRKEVLDLLFTLGNIYIVMFLFTVLIAFLLSEQIIAPLKELQEKIKQLKVGHKYEKIDYKRQDEIGRLVEEYNNMVEKLEESVQLLAKSERENAWRDMAKQVAHEIKNPLTPMKLSIQLLQKAWENGDADFGDRLNEVTQTLIEQIENLRNIAEEFSNFAKMPKSENEKIDLAQKIENLVKLYENIDNVHIKAIIKNRPVYIWADNKQISRALINLIKNALQAIPEGVKGLVIVELEKKENKALIKVIDNGTGIPDDVKHKLFTPSFTTKSSGMGLGLSMVKNIVQNAKGKIWFDTELGKGTTFYIEFPLYQESS